MVSVSDICNNAIGHVQSTAQGQKISNLETDTFANAEIVQNHYDISRRFLLAQHGWNFAKKRVNLTLASDLAQGYWRYKYVFPNDCVQMVEIERDSLSDSQINFEVLSDVEDTKVILSNKQNAIGIYMYDATNPEIFSPAFVFCFGWFLATQIALPMTQSLRVQQMVQTIYANVLPQAKTMDSNEGQSDFQADAPWVTARLGNTQGN